MAALVGMVSRWWWGGEPDAPHAVSGLSRRDLHLLQRSWALIHADAPANGYLMFSRLFEADPESQSFFTYVADAPEVERARSVKFKAHVVFIMSALNAAVANLAQPEVVVPMMEKLGASHHRLHIRRKHFRVFREVLTVILSRDLQLGADVVQAWGRFVDFMYRHMFTAVTE